MHICEQPFQTALSIVIILDIFRATLFIFSDLFFGTTKCVKITVICDVGTAQCEDGTVKCEKKITWYSMLLISGYRTPLFLGRVP